MFSGGWNEVYLKLYSDSNLLAYKKQGDREAKVQIKMKVLNTIFSLSVSKKKLSYCDR